MTFKKDQCNVFLWASSLTDIPGKTWWLLAFSPDCLITERSGIALDGARSSGAGVVLSEWCHTMLHCESLEGEHSSHTSFAPPASPPPGQHTNPLLLLQLPGHPAPPRVILFLPRGLSMRCVFLSRIPPTFPGTAVFYLQALSWGAGRRLLCAVLLTSQWGQDAQPASPLQGRKENGLSILAGASSGTLLSSPAEVFCSKALLLTNIPDLTHWILELLETLETKFNSSILAKKKLKPREENWPGQGHTTSESEARKPSPLQSLLSL